MPRATKKDPTKPKRATSAFFFYMAAEREKCKERGENMSKIAEFAKTVSEKWKSLSDSEKKPFEAQAAKDKERYTRQMACYVPSKETTVKATKRPAKDPNKPKKAQSAYFLFLADFRVRRKEDFLHEGGSKELIKAAGKEWNKMSGEEKAPYLKQNEVEKVKYEDAMAKYSAAGDSASSKKARKVDSDLVVEFDEDEKEELEEPEDEESEEESD